MTYKGCDESCIGCDVPYNATLLRYNGCLELYKGCDDLYIGWDVPYKGWNGPYSGCNGARFAAASRPRAAAGPCRLPLGGGSRSRAQAKVPLGFGVQRLVMGRPLAGHAELAGGVHPAEGDGDQLFRGGPAQPVAVVL